MGFDSVEDVLNELRPMFLDTDPSVIESIAQDIYFGVISYDDGVEELEGGI